MIGNLNDLHLRIHIQVMRTGTSSPSATFGWWAEGAVYPAALADRAIFILAARPPIDARTCPLVAWDKFGGLRGEKLLPRDIHG